MSQEPEGRFADLPKAERPVYRLLVQAEPRVDEVRALRSLLKTMLRGYGLRCVSITKEEK
jgi:hypothetical protein